MKVGLIGFSGSGKTTVYNALTGQRAETGYAAKGSGKTNLGVVKVPDARVDALASIHNPKKTTFAEIVFVDVPAQPGAGKRSLDQTTIAAMRAWSAMTRIDVSSWLCVCWYFLPASSPTIAMSWFREMRSPQATFTTWPSSLSRSRARFALSMRSLPSGL